MKKPWPGPLEVVDPLGGFRPFVEGISGLDESDRARRGVLLHATLPRPPVAGTPHEVVHTQDKLSLRYYDPARLGADPARSRRRPVVVVPSMINKYWICDLEPDRSLVGALARAGHPTYIVDWGEPGPEDAEEDVAYVVLNLLHRAIDRACRHAGAARAAVLGYCQGGTLAAMYTALRPRRVAGLVALNTPVRFSEGGAFLRLVGEGAVDVEGMIGPDGLVPVELMKSGFKLLDPMGNWHKYIALEADSHNPQRLARTLARERWLEENVPVSGAFAREFVAHTYRGDDLLEGGWALAGERVDLKAITCPVNVVACERDFIAPAAACTPLAEAVGSEDVELNVLPIGHIGVVVGSFAPKVFFPMLDRWFRRIHPEGSR